MASPRVFVSSTCYDLKEIRLQLKEFIEGFGFEAVLSEFGDIFYDYTKHVQDACLSEINKCQLFTLIIGNTYGSLYHKHNKNEGSIPDSVTLKEFKTALENNIYKHIFINKFVNYDYKNYLRALDEEKERYFNDNEVSEDSIESTVYKIKKNFDLTYPFPQKSYKYIFYFLDVIYSISSNNAVIEFETFDEIKVSLRKQWSGFMYESLIKKENVPFNIINPILSKIEKLETQIQMLINFKTVKSENEISFNTSQIVSEINAEKLESDKDKLSNILTDIFYQTYPELNYIESRIELKRRVNDAQIKEWLTDLDQILKKYKWSKFISVESLFKEFPCKFWVNRKLIEYTPILELRNLYNSLDLEDKEPFINTVLDAFNEHLSKEAIKDLEFEDDIPPF